jgi:hypothetical protein
VSESWVSVSGQGPARGRGPCVLETKRAAGVAPSLGRCLAPTLLERQIKESGGRPSAFYVGHGDAVYIMAAKLMEQRVPPILLAHLGLVETPTLIRPGYKLFRLARL